MRYWLCHLSNNQLLQFCSVTFVSCVSGKPDQLSSWVFARAPFSITTTSFCNYKLGCTHTRHQVGPGLKAHANRSHHPANLNLFLCESCSLFSFF